MKKCKKKKFFQKKNSLIKKKIGTKRKPRLSIARSNNHIYAQLVDDTKAISLCFSSTLKQSLFQKPFSKATKFQAFIVGQNLADQARIKGITAVMFDRGCHKYQGLIKSLADGARKNGLLF